ncbi:hypothetical protein KF707_13465 [Candidatus Obscuribacterales bacterium]|nr:hypothetical protein [Candidatus Obscuribacterales bacterium]MBX3152303.1 hypothetical protein [Candidatus Obscuribacterales bacterium]
MFNDEQLPLQIIECDGDDSGKTECPAILGQIWKRQLRSRQIASETAYAKTHSLEMKFGPKFFASKLVDRSNYTDRVA